jgi:hypothetical protein
MAILSGLFLTSSSLQILQTSLISVTLIQFYCAPGQHQLFATQMGFIGFGTLEKVIFLFSPLDAVLNTENLAQYANAK